MTQTITPYLCVADARAALDWYCQHFRATVTETIDWNGKVGHAELTFGGATFYLSDEAPDLGVLAPPTIGTGSATSFVVLVADVDGFAERARAGGAILQRPIEVSHGSRNAWLLDPFGHRWNVRTPVVDRAVAAGLRKPAEPYYLTLSSPDVARAATFYGAVLDWQYAPPGPEGSRHVTNTRQPMGLRPTQGPNGETRAGEISLWFIARDFDDALDRVRGAGGMVKQLTTYDSGREAICADDQGVEFRLSEPAPGYAPDA